MPQTFHSPVLIGLVLAVGVFCALRTLTSWVKGLHLLIVVVLFGGIVGARLGSTPFPIAFRDVAIVLPLYVVFLLSKAGSRALRAVPADFGEPAIGKLLIFDGLSSRLREMRVRRAVGCLGCANSPVISA